VVKLNGYARIIKLELEKLLNINSGKAFTLNDNKDLLLLDGKITLSHSREFLNKLHRLTVRHRTYRVGGWWFVDILDDRLFPVATFSLTGAAFTPDIEEARCIVYRCTTHDEALFLYYRVLLSSVPVRPEVALELLRALLVLHIQEQPRFTSFGKPSGKGVQNGRLEKKQLSILPHFYDKQSVREKVERYKKALYFIGVDLEKNSLPLQ